MNAFRNILKKAICIHPLAVLLLSIISCVMLVYVFTRGKTDSPSAYAAYVLSAYTLTVICFRIPQAVKSVRRILHGNAHIRRYLTTPELRARISVYAGLFIHILYAVFKFASGIYYGSFWFGAESVYHFILSISQFVVIYTDRKNAQPIAEWRAYRNCGVIMLFLNLAISVIVFMTVADNGGFVYSGVIIYATAFYTFYRVIMSFVHIGKFRKGSRPLLSASKFINLSASLMSLFALQTAMLTQFGGDDINPEILNMLTGIFVCFSVIYVAVSMIIRAGKEINRITTQTY